MLVARGTGAGGREEQVKGPQYLVTETGWTVGGEHVMQYTEDVLYKCTPETYVVSQYHPSKFNIMKKDSWYKISSDWPALRRPR